MIHRPWTAILVYPRLLSVFDSMGGLSASCPPHYPLKRTEIYRNKRLSFHHSLFTHKGVTSFCQQEKIACFPLTSLYSPLLGDRGVNISYYGDCTSPSKRPTFLVVYDNLERVYACVQKKTRQTVALVLCNMNIQGLVDSFTAV